MICIQMGCFVDILQQEDVNSLKYKENNRKGSGIHKINDETCNTRHCSYIFLSL